MTKSNVKKALMHLKKIQQLMSKVSSPYRHMSKQEIIDDIRKTREELWEKRIASHSR